MEAHTFMLLTSVMAFDPGEANYICFSCFSCPLSEAESIDMVYNKHSTAGDFWLRNGSALASCNFSSVYASKRKCSVCLKNPVGAETVVMVVCNLTSWEEPIFEGQHGDISFNKTDCPQPEHIGTDPNNDRGRIGLYISLGCFIAVLLLILLAWKHHKSQQDTSSSWMSEDL